MKVTLRILTIIILTTTNCAGQKNVELQGMWIIDKMVVNDKGFKYETTEVVPDTIILTDKTFEQKVFITDDPNGSFLLTQKGNYEIRGKKLIFKDRVTSKGEPGKTYPIIEFKYKVKNDQLILEEKSDVPETEDRYVTVWYYYKRK